MTSPLSIDPFDRALRDALAARTRARPDDARLLAAILDATGAATQERPHWRLPVWPRPAVVGLVGLVLVTLLVALVVGALSRRPPPLTGNGPIVVAGEGGRLAIDPLTGERLATSAAPVLRVTGWVDADWSPDGRRLAISDASSVRIADVDAPGAAQAHPVVRCDDPGYCTLDWFPDGRTLAVATDRAIVRLDPTTDTVETILEASGDIATFHEVAVSPDGRHIAYSTSDPAGESVTLRILDLETGIETSLATRAADWFPYVGLTWTPDGGSLIALNALASMPRGGGDRDPGGNQLYVERIDAETAATAFVTDAGVCFCVGLSPGFALAPDGASFVVVSGYDSGDGRFSLKRYAIDGGPPVVLTHGVNGMPAWQPIPSS